MCFITQTSSPCDHPQCKAIQSLINQQLTSQTQQAFSIQQQQSNTSKDNLVQQLLSNFNTNLPSYNQILLQQQLLNQQQAASTQQLNQLLLQSGTDDLNFLLGDKRKYDPNSTEFLTQLLMQQQSQLQKKVKVDPLQQLLQQATRQQTTGAQNCGGALQQLQQQQNLSNALNSILPKMQNQNQLIDLATLFSTTGQNSQQQQQQQLQLQQQQIQSSQQLQQNLLQNILQKQISKSNSSSQMESPLENNNAAMIIELGQIKKSSFDSQISQEETQDSVTSNAFQCKSPDAAQKINSQQLQQKNQGNGGGQQQICAKKREEIEDQSKGQQYIKYEEIPQNIRECIEEKKKFQYQLVLKEEFPKTLQRNKNFSISCELHNNQGKKIFNTNKIVLSVCALTYDMPQRLINLSKNWKKMVLGKTTTNLYQGLAYFDQVQLNAVTTYYKNSCIQIIIFPQQQLLEISEQSSNQFHVDFLEIKPIIIDNVVVKTRITDFINSAEQQQKQQSSYSQQQQPSQLAQFLQQQNQQSFIKENQGSTQLTASLQSLFSEQKQQQQPQPEAAPINNPFENQSTLFNQLKLLSENSQLTAQFQGAEQLFLQQLNQNLQAQQQQQSLSDESSKKPIQRQNIILKQIPTNELLNQSTD